MASRFENEIGFAHGARENIGVLLSNLGTPDLPTPRAVRRYLRQFLSDPAVIEAPAWRWQPILRAFVLPFRPRRVAALYRSIWTPVGSPLFAISRRQKSALEAALNPAATKDDAAVKVALGMRYGEPSLARALAELRAQNCRRLVVLPLYPQYANSTTGTVFDEIARALAKRRHKPHLRFVASYCDEPGYIDALARSITNHQSERGKPDLLLFSFHGTPRAMLEGGDPYHCLCQKTARQAAAAAGLAEGRMGGRVSIALRARRMASPLRRRNNRRFAAARNQKTASDLPGFRRRLPRNARRNRARKSQLVFARGRRIVFLHSGAERRARPHRFFARFGRAPNSGLARSSGARKPRRRARRAKIGGAQTGRGGVSGETRKDSVSLRCANDS